MNLTEVRNRPVVDVSTARTVARVAGVAVDATTSRIVGFHLDRSEGGDWIDWSDVKALGNDALTVVDLTHLHAAGELEKDLAQRTTKAVGGLVLDDHGFALGRLSDLELDETSGAVTGVVVDSGAHFEGHELLGVGRYATVVGAALPPPQLGTAVGPPQ